MVTFLVNHPLLILVGYVLLIVGIAVCFHKLIYANQDQELTERVEQVSCWDSLPEKWHPYVEHVRIERWDW